jgi:carbonic anhydrase
MNTTRVHHSIRSIRRLRTVGAIAVTAIALSACGSSKDSATSAEAGAPTAADLRELEHRVDELETEVASVAEAAASTEAEPAGESTGAHDASAEEPAEEPAAHATGAVHWTYAEAAEWGELAAEFGTCGTGVEQSPIDLTQPVAMEIADAIYQYVPSEATVTDNGHTVQVNFAAGGTLQLDGKTYSLLQFHFHGPSEHTVDGASWPLEVHFVHKADDGALAVVGVLIAEGAEAPAYGSVISAIPAESGTEVPVPGPLDAATMLPPLKLAYRYDGSLTTPPCSEGVAWSVLEATITMSAEQIESIRSHFAEPNNRPVQPINERELDADLTAG